mmetsp:Transcript_32229/g.85987  ORF Transcript_32229/g.85987 Transcript_32229/m.85987 type:complete len:215 (-) Transcript_32229:545-1189(-)
MASACTRLTRRRWAEGKRQKCISSNPPFQVFALTTAHSERPSRDGPRRPVVRRDLAPLADRQLFPLRDHLQERVALRLRVRRHHCLRDGLHAVAVPVIVEQDEPPRPRKVQSLHQIEGHPMRRVRPVHVHHVVSAAVGQELGQDLVGRAAPLVDLEGLGQARGAQVVVEPPLDERQHVAPLPVGVVLPPAPRVDAGEGAQVQPLREPHGRPAFP